MQSAFYLSVEDVAAVGFLNRQGFQVFLLDVIVDGSYQQILRRYADFVALQTALENMHPEERNDAPLPHLPSFKLLFPRKQWKGETVLVPQLELITQYCKALIELTADLTDSHIVTQFLSPNDFDTQMKRRHISSTQSQAKPNMIPQGSFFKKCLLIGDYFHASSFGAFDSHAGEILAIIGYDSEKWSLVGRSLKGGMQLGWLPPSYTIDLPDDDEDPMMDDVHHFLLCVETNEKSSEDDTIVYPKYQVIGPLVAEEDANLPSRLLNLMPGDTVYVTDKDEDGWWYVSGETGEGWYPSTLLRVYSSFMPQDTTESDVVYQDTESVNRSHQPEIFYTLREYSGERDDEVSFGEGMPLRVLHKSKSGWWTVRCAGKVGLCPAVYLGKNLPPTKRSPQARRPGSLQHTATTYGFSTLPLVRPLLQRSLTVYKPPVAIVPYSIGFNASQSKVPPPRNSCPELEADVRVESALEHKRTKQLVKVKMTSREKILKSLKRRLLDLSKRSAAAQVDTVSSGFENTRTMRRVSTHVSAQQVYPTSLPGSPVLDRWCWHETSEGSEMEHAIPSRFAARNTPVDHWRGKKDSSRFSRRVASLTGGSSSLPGSPVLKLKSSKTTMQHKGVAIPQRFLDHYESLHTESSQLSTSHVPKRFITET